MGSVFESFLVALFVVGVEVAPIAAVVAVHGGCQVDAEVDGTGRGNRPA